MSSAETSTGVAREHLFSVTIFSCSLEIPPWSSKFRLLRCMFFCTFRKTHRLSYRNSALRRSLNFLRSEPIFHYKRSSRGPFCLLGPRCEHRRGHMPVVIGLLDSSHMTCPKTKLRELSLWHVVSLHVCSTSLFLEFKDDISNHRITLATATFSSKKQTNCCFNYTCLCEALSYAFLTFCLTI